MNLSAQQATITAGLVLAVALAVPNLFVRATADEVVDEHDADLTAHAGRHTATQEQITELQINQARSEAIQAELKANQTRLIEGQDQIIRILTRD